MHGKKRHDFLLHFFYFFSTFNKLHPNSLLEWQQKLMDTITQQNTLTFHFPSPLTSAPNNQLVGSEIPNNMEPHTLFSCTSTAGANPGPGEPQSELPFAFTPKYATHSDLRNQVKWVSYKSDTWLFPYSISLFVLSEKHHSPRVTNSSVSHFCTFTCT